MPDGAEDRHGGALERFAAVLATLVFRFIEQPAVRVGHRLMTRLRQPTRAARAISSAA